MGTQQILLIVLSVIIVGVAIVVGIGMFNRQAYNSNAQAIAADARNYATEIVQYWNTPRADGGAGAAANDSTAVYMTTGRVSERLFGASTHVDLASGSTNENGTFWVSKVSATSPYNFAVTGRGKAVRGGKSPRIVTTVTLPAGTIAAVATNE